LAAFFALAGAVPAWLAPCVPDVTLAAAAGALAEVPAAGPTFAGAVTEASPDICGLVMDLGLWARNGTIA